MTSNSLCRRTAEHSIPSSAVEVHIHNILDPYTILVSNVKENAHMLEVIHEKLPGVMKQAQHSRVDEQNKELQAGTMTIVHGGVIDGIDLPAWYSRAIIVRYNEKTSKYIAFLPDHGEHVELSTESFVRVPHDTLTQPFFTYIICMYNILPVKRLKFNNSKKIQVEVENNWTPHSIDLIMQLICSSKKFYFHQITPETNGVKYGELYLIIDNNIIPLRQALIQAYCAVSITNQLLENQDKTESTITSNDSQLEEESEMSFIDNPNISDVSEAQRNIFHEILVSSDVECNHLHNITDASFDASILAALKKLSITRLRRLQSYVWPAINKGLDVLAVGPQKCGKTVGYAAPIASIIANTKHYQIENHSMALVLCSSSSQVLYIASIFGELLTNHPDIKMNVAFNGCSDRSLVAGIISGRQIFISTPVFLIRFFERDEHHKKLLKFNYISHLIIDDLDIILNKQQNALTQLLGRYTLVGKKHLQQKNILALQIVAAAREWSSLVGRFTNIFINPYICIGSFADAAIFCGIQMKPRFVSQELKKIKLKELLSVHYRLVKTLIVCANSDEADELHKYLSDDFQILYVRKNMLFTEIIGMREIWNSSVSGMYQLMICVDEVLPNLKIADVNWLIHYSIAVPSKAIFLFRFSTLMTNLRKRSSKIEVTIFIDDTNTIQFRGIMDLVKRSGVTIPPELSDKIERINLTLERNKKEFQLCNNVKAFGYCSKSGRCNYRHCVFADVDAPTTPLVTGNHVKMSITYVHNATHFSARITEYVDNESKRHELSDVEHIRITTKIHRYYSDKNNRCRSKDVTVGGIYAYDNSFDMYQRVQVLDIVAKDKEEKPLFVDLKCIDNGDLHNRVRTSQLLEIPKELAEAKAHIVEVFLANLLPYDDESEWNRCANECTFKWFADQLKTQDVFLQGKVCLHLGNTVWVDSLETRTKIKGRRELITSSLTSHLMEQKYGIINSDHMTTLKKLCANAGFTDLEDLDD